MADNGSKTPKPTQQVREILKIGLDQNNQVVVFGQIANKVLCMQVIGDALKAIAVFVPKKIVEPHTNIVKPTRH